jgi:hypothetical protein
MRLGLLKGSSVYVKVEDDKKKLSFTGVVGPMSNGNAKGECGQIIMSFKEFDERGYCTIPDIAPAPGWTHTAIKRLFELWDRWHLNDMRPNCPHQIGAEWDTRKKIDVVTYKLTDEARTMRDSAEERAVMAAKSGVVCELTPVERALLDVDKYETFKRPPDADSPLSGMLEVDKRENKTAGWVTQEEHPEGLLSKACPVCGYKYGNQWMFEAVPASVIEELNAFPPSDATPAWI